MPEKNQPGGLNDRAVRSIRWNAASTIVSTLLQVGQMIWLARLLTPGDFGAMAMTWVVIRTASPIFSGGIGQSIIQQKEIGREQLSTLFWVQTGLGVLAFAGVYATRPLWAQFFGEPQIPALLFACSLSFLAAPAGNFFQALLTRRLRFEKLASIQIAGAATDFLVSIWLAYRGWGPLSICWAYFLRNLLSTVLSWWMERSNTPSFAFQPGAVRSMLKFAFFETVNNLVSSLHTTLDKAILSRFMTVHDLGLYFIAWELAMAPLSRISPIFTRVSFPLFSKIREQPAELNRYYMTMTEPLITVNLFALAVLGFLSLPVLTALFGPEWAGAAICLAPLSFFGLQKVVVNTGAGLFLAKGRADFNFLWNLASTGAIFLFLLIFLSFSPTLVSASLAQVAALALLFGVWIAGMGRIGGIHTGQLALMLLRRAALAAPMMLVLLLWAARSGPPAGVLFGGLFSAFFVYLLTLWIFDRTLFKNLLR